MSTEQTIDTPAEDNLDDFSAEFFGENKETSDNAKSEDIVDNPKADSGAPTENEQDTQSAENGATEEEPSSEEDPTDDKGKPKKVDRYQERINELTAARRKAERERDELLQKLEEAEAPKASPKEESVEDEAPKPTDKNEDGTDKYPLGEFDPKYNADLVKYTVQKTLNEEREQREKQAAEAEKLTAEEKYRETLESTWNEKLEIVQERYPDFQEKGEQMLSVFEDIPQAYGQYLTDTLMEMDAGPEVFYYLANNLDQAQEIVNAGPRKATIALAKLEAQLAGTPTQETPKVKVTNAPKPPPQVKGSAVARASVSPDTDDLGDFEKLFFKK